MDLGLGESMPEVKRCGWPSDDHELTYMPESEMRCTLLEQGVSLGSCCGKKPDAMEVAARRIRETLQTALSMDGDSQNVLLVSHGDVLGQAVEMVTGNVVVEAGYCAWVVLKLERGIPDAASMLRGWGYTAISLE